jgi:hypothetical protein
MLEPLKAAKPINRPLECCQIGTKKRICAYKQVMNKERDRQKNNQFRQHIKPPNPSGIRNLQRFAEITRAMHNTAMIHNGVFHGPAKKSLIDILVHNTH